MLNKEQLLLQLNNSKITIQNRKDMLEKVSQGLEKFEGKKITKRFASNLEGVLGEGYKCFYSKEGSNYEIAIWNDGAYGLEYNNRQVIFLYEDEEGLFDYQKTNKKLLNRIEILNDNLNNYIHDISLAKDTGIVSEYNQKMEELKELCNKFRSGIKDRLLDNF